MVLRGETGTVPGLAHERRTPQQEVRNITRRKTPAAAPEAKNRANSKGKTTSTAPTASRCDWRKLSRNLNAQRIQQHEASTRPRPSARWRRRQRRRWRGDQHQHQHPNRAMESSGPEVKVRGPASHILRALSAALARRCRRRATACSARTMCSTPITISAWCARCSRRRRPPPQNFNDGDFEGDERAVPKANRKTAKRAAREGGDQPDVDFPEQQQQQQPLRPREGDQRAAAVVAATAIVPAAASALKAATPAKAAAAIVREPQDRANARQSASAQNRRSATTPANSAADRPERRERPRANATEGEPQEGFSTGRSPRFCVPTKRLDGGGRGGAARRAFEIVARVPLDFREMILARIAAAEEVIGAFHGLLHRP